MYVDSNHLDYKYLVSYSDNYLVLTNTRSVNGSWDRPAEIDTYIQYLAPSTYGFESYNTYTSTHVFPEIEVTDSYWERPDVSFINLSVFFIVILVLFVFNLVTEFISKGGLAR